MTLTLAALVASITVFVLAIFLGFELISKVPPTLHTPQAIHPLAGTLCAEGKLN